MFGLGKKKQAPLPSSGCLKNITLWKVPQPKQAHVLDGPEIGRIYVYDAAPLAAIDPDGFVLDVAYCDGIITSQYTGSQFNTAQEGFVIGMFNGNPVGTIDIDRNKVQQLAQQGYALKVTCFSDGWLTYGSQQIRNVKSRLPKDWA